MGKVSKLKEVFRQHFYDFFTLDNCFEQAFDFATKIFFFFCGEFTSFACLKKEYLGFFIFEKYENYLTSNLSNEKENTYLLPIFNDFKTLRSYYSLYQIKHSIILFVSMINSHHMLLHVLYQLFQVLVN